MPERFREAHGVYLMNGLKGSHWDAFELAGLHKGGRELPLELSFAEYTFEGKRFFTGIARDISERKRAEQALRESEGVYAPV